MSDQDQATIVEQIKEWIRDVDTYLGWKRRIGIETAAVEGRLHDDPKSDCNDLFGIIIEGEGQLLEAKARLRENAPALAMALEQAGVDASGLLSIIQCFTYNGGGADAAREQWGAVKVALERAVIWLRQYGGNANDRPAYPPKFYWETYGVSAGELSDARRRKGLEFIPPHTSKNQSGQTLTYLDSFARVFPCEYDHPEPKTRTKRGKTAANQGKA